MNLRPKLKTATYRLLDKNTRLTEVILPEDTYWGGAAAAEHYVDYLIPDKIQIYTGFLFNHVMKALRIIPDPGGNIILTQRFWPISGNMKTVHPIIIYADLVNEVNPRYTETANMLYNEFIKDHI